MSRPFFTVAIPTKNRSERVADAVKSVVGQTFADVEIIVCDNSDEADAARTAAVVGGFDDARVRYERTNGRLSMPDNWEHAIAVPAESTSESSPTGRCSAAMPCRSSATRSSRRTHRW